MASRRKAVGSNSSGASQPAAAAAKRSRAQTILDEIKQLGYMPRERKSVGKAESLLAMRLRVALRDGAFQSPDTAELKRLRKEFDRKGFDPSGASQPAAPDAMSGASS